MKLWKRRLLFVAVTLALALVGLEVAVRWMLFGGSAAFAEQRLPRKYADYYSEDLYWLLDHAVGSQYPGPSRPHPVLGWVGTFDRETYRHKRMDEVGGKRPVLLYGDSFAACMAEVDCFEDLLNADPEFAADHHLLNYGVGGYGLDQIWLLIEHSIDPFLRADQRPPFVVVSFMTYDLDRSVLSIRTGQKPRFAVQDGELTLVGPPIRPDPESYYADHPPEACSWAWRRLIRSPHFPRAWSRKLLGEAEVIAEKQALNAAILAAICDGLDARGVDYAFLVFHPNRFYDPAGRDPDWRDLFVRAWLLERGVPYLWSRDIVAAKAPAATMEDLHLPDNHPTTFHNALLAEELKALILK